MAESAGFGAFMSTDTAAGGDEAEDAAGALAATGAAEPDGAADGAVALSFVLGPAA
jgi:hypothetical protein